MLAFGRNILLWLSFSLLLMHSLVPHHHHDCQEKHLSESSTPDNPFSILLQTQLGEGHLEYFLTDGKINIKSLALVFFTESDSVFETHQLIILRNNSFAYTHIFFRKTPLDFQNTLRAPPLV